MRLFLVVFTILTLLWGLVYGAHKLYNNYLFRKNGKRTIATIIWKDIDHTYYDVEYKGKYYTDWVVLTKKAYRKVKVGERFLALVIPEELDKDRESDWLPKHFKIILSPLPSSCQDINGELERIDSIYGAINPSRHRVYQRLRTAAQ